MRTPGVFTSPRAKWLLLTILASCLALDCPTASAGETDWPQWRGPKRDGIWAERGIMARFPSDSLQAKWRVPLGPGYAGPAVSGGRVFVPDRQATRGTERLLAFDERTGEQLWKHEYSASYDNVDYASGPRATPTVDGDRVYLKGAMGYLACLRARDGEVLWQHDLVAKFGARIPTWGIVGAPLIERDVVIVNVGGEPDAAVVAFDKLTGAVKWQRLDDRPGYAPPVMIRAGDTRQLIYWSAQALNSLDPTDGTLYWRVPFEDRADMTICAPVLHNGHLFVSSYYGGSMMLRLADDRPAASVVWRDKRGQAARLYVCISTPLLKDQHLYAVDRSGELVCLEAATGDLIWKDDSATGGLQHGNAHITPNGDREFLFSETGELIITQLNPAGYRELSRTRLIAATAGVKDHRPVNWSHPAYANGHVFVRNDEELRCASLIAGSE